MTPHPSPQTFTCTCPPLTPRGLVLLFYAYTPLPPPSLNPLATFHSSLCTTLSLTCKIRIAPEGFNITIAGSQPAIASYIAACTSHWSFAGLDLQGESPDAEERRRAFFKPTVGCRCVFGGIDVRICKEITPFGVVGFGVEGRKVVELGPEEWHGRVVGGEGEGMVLLDVRNYYESRVGYFVDGRGGEAVRVGVRRFSQWARFGRERLEVELEGVRGERGEGEGVKQVMTYCTGGIRCEKAARWIAEQGGLEAGVEASGEVQVCTLKGGIVAYLAWMDDEIAAGRKTAANSLFKGRNYVFDARGTVGLSEGGDVKVASCHGCGKLEDKLGTCTSRGCQLVLVVCEVCEGEIRCCEDCRELDDAVGDGKRARICWCERERERLLWGGEGKVVKGQGWKKARRKEKGLKFREGMDLDIRVQTFN